MTLKGSCETETKTAGNQNYVRRKNGDTMELSFSVLISALLGVTDVRREAVGFVESANRGDTAYFYYGNKKLIPYKMMLTSAEITDIDPMPKKPNKWISCSARLTFKQAGDSDASSSSDSGSKKQSVRGTGAKVTAGGNTPKVQGLAGKVTAGIAATGAVREQGKIASKDKLVGTSTGGTSTGGGLNYQEGIIKKVQQTTNTAQPKPANTGRVPITGGTKWLATQR